MMNMGERISEEECNFLVEVNKMNNSIFIGSTICCRRLMWMVTDVSTLRSLLVWWGARATTAVWMAVGRATKKNRQTTSMCVNDITLRLCFIKSKRPCVMCFILCYQDSCQCRQCHSAMLNVWLNVWLLFKNFEPFFNLSIFTMSEVKHEKDKPQQDFTHLLPDSSSQRWC